MKVFLIGYVWPEPESSAAGLRTQNLIQACLNAQWEVTFGSAAQRNSFSDRLSGQKVRTVTLLQNDASFENQLREIQPDFVIFDRFVTEEQFGWRVREICPDAVRVIDLQDVHFLRQARQKTLKEEFEPEGLPEGMLRELAAIYRSDCAMVLSDFEEDLLVRRLGVPKEKIFLDRFYYDGVSTFPGFEKRRDFAMIGNFRHAPNADSVRWMRAEIWPLIRKELPDACVRIYGAYPPKDLMDLHQPDLGFLMEGPAENSCESLMKARINLAPLRFGAGIKGKITDGWCAGTPVVTTPIGAEGMSGGLPWGGEIAKANDPRDFARMAIDLYTNSVLWKQKQENGFKILNTVYAKSALAPRFIENLANLKRDLAESRRRNLIGAILNHDFQNRTKYFSKWIEEKNLNKSGVKLNSPRM